MGIEKKMPQIRFKGFSGEWSKKKIFSIAPLQRGFDLPKTEMRTGVYPVVMSNGVNGCHYKFKAKAPGVVTGRSGTIGNIHYIGVDYWPHNTALWVTNFNGNVPRFIYYLYVKLDLRKFGTGSGVPTLNRNDVHDQIVHLPRKSEEQTQIGNYFQKLDSLINEHQKKHDKLNNIKKAMLEKMFPKEGETIPEIRFKGFSGEWKEKRVSELGEVLTGSTPSTLNSINYSNHGVLWVTPTDIKENITRNSAKNLSKAGCKVARIVPQNTILVTCIASIGKNTILGTQGSFNQQINGVIPNEKYNSPYFLYTASILWSEKLKRSAASGTMQIVNKTEFSELISRVPEKQEQVVIGSYFQKLDRLINQHQQQITKLNNIKQACLSKMFV